MSVRRPPASLLAAAAVTVSLGAAVAVTAKQSPLLPLLGFVPWARWGAWAGVLAGLMGLLTVILSLRLWRDQRGPALGFLLTGLGAMGLSPFLVYWDLAPF